MSSKIRNVALLLPAFVLATGLASAQGVKVTTVNPDGSATSTNLTPTPNGPGAKAPTPAADGSAKYWDGLGIGGTSTNYFSQVPYLVAPPNPQIAAGPDDILTVVNRTVSRWPNPNALGNTGTLNPFNYPPTEYVPLDVWMGLTVLGTQAGGGALCPSGTGNNSNCVIDNASIRYDQLQGRFIVLFTVTDMPAHRSNWVVVVSTFSQFQKCPVPAPAGSVCPTSSPLFTPPVIAPIVGGTQTGGQNAANWTLYKIPINLLYNPGQQPSALGLVNNPNATPPFNNPLANSAVGTRNTITTGGQTGLTFLTTPFCPNGGPNLPLTYTSGNGTGGTGTAGGTGRTCTNYFPTGARFGFDDDNIILTAPVLDQAFAANEGNFPSGGGQSQGPYAGTRVTTIAKIIVYNGLSLNFTSQPPQCLGDTPVDCTAVNLADNTATGTLSVIQTQVAFGQGAITGLGTGNGDLQYGAGTPNTPNSCITNQPVAVPAASTTPATPPAPPFTAAQAVLSCAPLATLTTAIPPVFWEPDNLRGRPLASFDAQVAPFNSVVAGVVTPIDYIVGTKITDNFGQGIVPQGVSGIAGQKKVSVTVTATAFTVAAAACSVAAPCTMTVSPADATKLAIGEAIVTPNGLVSPAVGSGVAAIISIDLVGGVITLTAQALPTGTTLPAPVTFGASFGATPTPPTAGVATQYFIQPIAFSCPGSSALISDFGNCVSGAPGGQSLVADLPLLGPLKANASTLAQVADPAPVGQGFSAQQMTTQPLNVPVSPTTNTRIFVGDSRPEQVMFREGLLSIARTVRLGDLATPINWLGTSTVLYDIIKTCATAAPLPACGNYDAAGANIGTPNLAFEYEWFNGTSVPDPNGDINGFGFYTPMFESPADVVQSGPISPISTLQLFDKLFVGMTTGGTSNTAAIFSMDYPSLWDFRRGDDAFDTVEPYLDPYTGIVQTTYVCGGNINVVVLSRSGNTITVADPTGLGAGMFQTGTQLQIVSIAGNVVTLTGSFGSGSTTFPTNATFTRVQPVVSVTATLVTPGSNQITVSSATGLTIGQVLANGSAPSAGGSTNAGTASPKAYTCTTLPCPPNVTASTAAFGISSLTNVGFGEKITGNLTGNVSAISGTTIGSFTITVPNSAQVAPGMLVTGTGIPAGASISTAAQSIFINPDGTLQITLTAAETLNQAGPVNVKFDSTPCFAGANFVTGTTNASQFVVGGVNQPGILSVSGALAAGICTSFYADPTNGSTTGQPGGLGSALATALNGATIQNGIPVTFTAQVGSGTGNFFGTGLSIINVVGNTVTLSGNASAPLPGLIAGQTSTNLPFNFTTTATTANSNVTCPIIPWSQHGGASTDPNDGSLWLFGEFAKNRLSTIPGPGQWGTSVANYALSFPAVDAYGNDNTYFQDVQPAGSPDSGFFTWIQLAKNLGLAVPSATGPCTINNGLPPVLTPPAPGTLPNPSPSNLGCPYFGPDTVVTRAEMAYWVVRSIMDDTMVSNYLCATGGDPSGRSPQCSAGLPASSFADLGAGGGSILNPFLGAIPSLNIAGVTNAQLMQYIEVMARRGITKGCNSTTDPQAAYCPNQPVTRAQMSVFLIRAKMDNVFPTTLSGIPLASPYGDNFGTFLPPVPYFSDVTASDPVYGLYYPFIQKMRELRITNGTGGVSFSPGNNLTRKEIAVFVVRAFFL